MYTYSGFPEQNTFSLWRHQKSVPSPYSLVKLPGYCNWNQQIFTGKNGILYARFTTPQIWLCLLKYVQVSSETTVLIALQQEHLVNNFMWSSQILHVSLGGTYALFTGCLFYFHTG